MSGHFYSPICCIKILRHIKQANFELFVVNRCWFQIYSGLFCDQPGSLTSKAEHNVLIFSDLWREMFFLCFSYRFHVFLSYIYIMDKPERGTDLLVYSNARHKKANVLISQNISPTLSDAELWCPYFPRYFVWFMLVANYKKTESSLYFSSIKLSKSCSVISVLLGDSVGYVELLQ